MKTYKKSQVSLEFIIIIGAVIFLFIALFSLISGNLAFRLKQKDLLAVKEIAFSVIDEIHLALSSVDGYYRGFDLPEKINNKAYEINITENMVYVRTNDGKSAIALPAPNSTGQPVKGMNIIKKENGKVYINQ